MTVYLFLQCALAGLLGIAFHLFAVKLPEIKKNSQAANHPLTKWEILKMESDNIIASVLGLLVILFIFSEVINYKPAIVNWARTLFATIGFSGSTLVLSFFGKAEKAIRQVVDKKTNIADGVE